MLLSLAMIVRNEEATLGRVLADAGSVCDELVVVDTGSTDATVEVARSAGARVLDFAWVDDFAAARNASFEACQGEWILWLDADDRLAPEVQQRLREVWRPRLRELPPSTVAVSLPYRYAYDGERVVASFPRERILRASAHLRWQNPVHEVIAVPPGGQLDADDVWVEHRPLAERRALNTGRNLRILERHYDAGDRRPRTLFYLANELRDNDRPADAAVVYAEYLATGAAGWEGYWALISRGDCLDRSGDTAEARACYVAAVDAQPARAEGHLRLGVLHFRAQEWAAAAPWFAAATACLLPAEGFVDPRDYGCTPWDYLSVCWSRLGRPQEALAALGRAAQGNPDLDRLVDNARWILGDLAQR